MPIMTLIWVSSLLHHHISHLHSSNSLSHLSLANHITRSSELTLEIYRNLWYNGVNPKGERHCTRATLDIIFKTSKLEKECNNYRLLQKAHGERRARLIRRRLDELHAATTLSEISYLPPPRMHQLKGERQGQISLDLDHPYRLLVTVANNPVPKKDNGSLNLSKVTAVMVLGIEDTHD